MGRFLWIALGLLLVGSALGQGLPDATVQGRVLLEDGSPAVGVRVQLTTWQYRKEPGAWLATKFRTGRYTAKSDQAGWYSFRCRGAVNGSAEIEAGYPNCGLRRVSWTGPLPCENKEVEGLVVAPPCFLLGHLESGDGQLLTEGWSVMGISENMVSWEIGVGFKQSGIDPDAGTFRLGPFPPGPVRIVVRGPKRTNIREYSCIAKPAETTYVAIQAEDLVPEACLRFRLVNRRFPGVVFESIPISPKGAEIEGLVIVNGEGIAILGATKRSSGPFDWELGPLDKEEYDVELRHPAFEPLRLQGLVPGREHSLDLKGSSSLVVDVVDAAGTSITNYGARVLYDRSTTKGVAHTYTSIGDPRPPGGRLEGLVPGDVALVITLADGRTVTQWIMGLEAQESRRVRVEV